MLGVSPYPCLVGSKAPAGQQFASPAAVFVFVLSPIVHTLFLLQVHLTSPKPVWFHIMMHNTVISWPHAIYTSGLVMGILPLCLTDEEPNEALLSAVGPE